MRAEEIHNARGYCERQRFSLAHALVRFTLMCVRSEAKMVFARFSSAARGFSSSSRIQLAPLLVRRNYSWWSSRYGWQRSRSSFRSPKSSPNVPFVVTSLSLGSFFGSGGIMEGGIFVCIHIYILNSYLSVQERMVRKVPLLRQDLCRTKCLSS